MEQSNLPGVWSILTPLIFMIIIFFSIWFFSFLLNRKGTDNLNDVWNEAAQEYDERDKGGR